MEMVVLEDGDIKYFIFNFKPIEKIRVLVTPLPVFMYIINILLALLLSLDREFGGMDWFYLVILIFVDFMTIYLLLRIGFFRFLIQNPQIQIDKNHQILKNEFGEKIHFDQINDILDLKNEIFVGSSPNNGEEETGVFLLRWNFGSKLDGTIKADLLNLLRLELNQI